MDTIKANQIIQAALHQTNESLGKLMGADVMVLKSGMHPPIDDIIRSEIEGIKEDKKSKDKLVVIVETTGGFIEVVERIVNVFRKHYKEVHFVVPNYAYSAGTVLIMSGDEIYMDYYSILGPIDPQFESEDGNYVPGMGYLAKYQELLEQINDPAIKDANEVRAQIAFLIKRFDPAKLFTIEQSIEHSKSLLRDWLPKYKFKDWKKTEHGNKRVTPKMRSDRADAVAEVLGDAGRWHSHGRGISIRELESEEIKLKIKDFGADDKLDQNVRHYHGLFIDFIGKRGMKGAIHTQRGLRRTA